MYFVYLIKSCKRNWFYTGFTRNIERRLREHNLGQSLSTKSYKPFILVFVQQISNRLQARNLEKYLKVKYNKEALLDLVI